MPPQATSAGFAPPTIPWSNGPSSTSRPAHPGIFHHPRLKDACSLLDRRLPSGASTAMTSAHSSWLQSCAEPGTACSRGHIARSARSHFLCKGVDATPGKRCGRDYPATSQKQTHAMDFVLSPSQPTRLSRFFGSGSCVRCCRTPRLQNRRGRRLQLHRELPACRRHQ